MKKKQVRQKEYHVKNIRKKNLLYLKKNTNLPPVVFDCHHGRIEMIKYCGSAGTFERIF